MNYRKIKRLIRKALNSDYFFTSQDNFKNCLDDIQNAVKEVFHFDDEGDITIHINGFTETEQYDGVKITIYNEDKISKLMKKDKEEGVDIASKYKKGYIVRGFTLELDHLYPDCYLDKNYFNKEEQEYADKTIFCNEDDRVDCFIDLSVNHIDIKYTNRYNDKIGKQISEEEYADKYLDFNTDEFIKKVDALPSILDEKINKVAKAVQEILKSYVCD
jgi:phage terminase large subunit-like protein